MVPRNSMVVVLLCTVQISCSSTTRCQLSNNRALFISIVMTIPIGRSLPKPIVPGNSNSWTEVVAPTSPIHVNLPKSNVHAIPINRQPVKSFASTISIDRHAPSSFVWAIPIIYSEKQQTSIVQAFPMNGQSLKSIVRAISIDRESPKLFVRTIPIVGQYTISIVRVNPIHRQFPRSIVWTISIARQSMASLARTISINRVFRDSAVGAIVYWYVYCPRYKQKRAEHLSFSFVFNVRA